MVLSLETHIDNFFILNDVLINELVLVGLKINNNQAKETIFIKCCTSYKNKNILLSINCFIRNKQTHIIYLVGSKNCNNVYILGAKIKIIFAVRW